ncbi:unnamed protein product [Strongylus vulgaris]|uniref:Uncharacterized protein n=1 Tax=Strongylus vulgaris TaxID=40348 RepID=A0A3P7KDN6_STRVU|nr:unnamed protein product [Strongylus vulgaris]
MKGFDDVDELGNQKSYGVLTKYDEELDGVQKEKFRLDECGGYDLEKDEREERMRKELELAGKMLVSLDMPKYQIGSEFYTKDEMTAFRKVKKGKKSTRKRKMLKAEDLVPDEPAEERSSRSRNHGRRQEVKKESEEEAEGKAGEQDIAQFDANMDEAESEVQSGLWKKATKNAVNIDMLKSVVDIDHGSESSEEEFEGGSELAGVVIDDDAEAELATVLEKARRLKQVDVKQDEVDVAQRVRLCAPSFDDKLYE